MLRILFVCSSFMAMSFPAGAFEIACPDKIVTSQKLVAHAPAWKAFVRPGGDASERNWSRPSRIDLYDGDPQQIVQLKPDDENSPEDTWTLGAPSTAERPIYMSCVYFDTRIEFIKALPLNIKKCTASREAVLRCEEFKP